MLQKFHDNWVRFSDVDTLNEGDFIYLKNNGIAYVDKRNDSLYIECVPNKNKTSFKYNPKDGFVVYNGNGKLFDLILFVTRLETKNLNLINDIDTIINLNNGVDELNHDLLDTYKDTIKIIFEKYNLSDIIFRLDFNSTLDGVILIGHREIDKIAIKQIFGSNEIQF